MQRNIALFNYYRILAVLLGISYGWLSSAGSFQHTDYLAPHTSKSVVLSLMRSSSHPQIVEHSIRCAACDWQAANVSAALLPYVFMHWAASNYQEPTHSLDSVHNSLIHSFSRGPPFQII